jgi:hypothetical protein
MEAVGALGNNTSSSDKVRFLFVLVDQGSLVKLWQFVQVVNAVFFVESLLFLRYAHSLVKLVVEGKMRVIQDLIDQKNKANKGRKKAEDMLEFALEKNKKM